MKYQYLSTVLLLFFMQAVFAQQRPITVAQDGSGDFRTVQQAINAVTDSSLATTTIFIRNGVYKEKLRLSASKMNVRMVGQSVDRTILTFDDYASKKDSAGNDIGTSGSASFFVFGSGFTAENITFENSAGPVGQAVAVRITGDKATFVNCRFLGFQDTLYTHGEESRQYYYKCYIEGTVDFIFGAATVLFERCTIYGKKGGYYTAASTPAGNKFGYVFRDCHITGEGASGSFFLGRPWRPFAKSVFIHCRLDKVVNPVGWHNWSHAENEKTAYYAEYKNYGDGAAIRNRVPWSKQLSADEAKEYNTNNIFDGWNPLCRHQNTTDEP